MKNETILIVEDDGIIAIGIGKMLTDLGYVAEGPADSSEEAIRKAEELRPSLILMDIQLIGETDGIETAEIIRSRFDIPVIYLTAYSDDARLEHAKATMPYGYLIKPVHGRELRAAIEMALYRHRTDRKLKESEERYHAVMSQALDGIFLFDPDTRRISEANPAFRNLLGHTREQIEELTADDIIGHDHVEQIIRHCLGKGQYASGEQRYRRENGSHADVIVNASLISSSGRHMISVVIHDITELRRAEEFRRRTEAHLHQTRRTMSLGRMAGAVAHNFNNIMATILGYSELAESELEPDSPARPMIRKIVAATTRATKITRQILEYTGQIHGKPRQVHLSRLITDMKSLIGAGISDKTDLRYDLRDDVPMTDLDADQIRQMMANLISNAAEAIGDNEGIITIRTGVVDAKQAFLPDAHSESEVPEGKYVFVDVSDTGCGMDEATKSEIFDPFFSTKFLGRGLGLPAVLGIVRQHRGYVGIFSKEGSGTTVRILFPIRDKESA